MEQTSILIVEDEIVTAMEIGDVLTLAGYSVLPIARSGEEAIAAVQQSKPDLVLMDIRLAGQLDGVETASIIRKFPGTAVVYLTGFGDDPTFRRAVETCPHGFLKKPFEPAELLRCLEMTLKRRTREGELESRASWYEGTATFINMAILVTNADGVLVHMNQEAERLTGWNWQDATQKHVTEVCVLKGPVLADIIDDCAAMPAIAEHPPPLLGTRLVARTGAVIPVELNVVPVRDASGCLKSTVLAFRDITHLHAPESVWLSYAFYLCKLADFSCGEEDYPSAQFFCRKVRLIAEKYGNKASPLMADLLECLAMVYKKMGEPAEALVLECEAAELRSTGRVISWGESFLWSKIASFWHLLRGSDRGANGRCRR